MNKIVMYGLMVLWQGLKVFCFFVGALEIFGCLGEDVHKEIQADIAEQGAAAVSTLDAAVIMLKNVGFIIGVIAVIGGIITFIGKSF